MSIVKGDGRFLCYKYLFTFTEKILHGKLKFCSAEVLISFEYKYAFIAQICGKYGQIQP